MVSATGATAQIRLSRELRGKYKDYHIGTCMLPFYYGE